MTSRKVLYLICIALFTATFLSLGNDSKQTDQMHQKAISESPFDIMMQVLTHQRCVNCHPSASKPRKGDDSHITRSLGIPRGDDGHGLQSISCATCHSTENNDYSGVPGAPDWALAPESMTWEGKTRVEIATQMMDPKTNGGKSPQEILKHLTEHELVLWAWDPGVDAEGIPREKPPIPKDEYIKAVKDWISSGAVIPAE